MDPLPPRVFGLWHLALNVRVLAPMERFYVDVLGMRVEWRPDADNVYLTSGCDNLAIHVRHDLPPVGTPGALDHLGFFVAAAPDVDAWHSRILQRVGRADTEPRTHRDGARSFYFRDPEQNRIQILHHLPVIAAVDAAASPRP